VYAGPSLGVYGILLRDKRVVGVFVRFRAPPSLRKLHPVRHSFHTQPSLLMQHPHLLRQVPCGDQPQRKLRQEADQCTTDQLRTALRLRIHDEDTSCA
jgi:hypothetical protein